MESLICRHSRFLPRQRVTRLQPYQAVSPKNNACSASRGNHESSAFVIHTRPSIMVSWFVAQTQVTTLLAARCRVYTVRMLPWLTQRADVTDINTSNVGAFVFISEPWRVIYARSTPIVKSLTKESQNRESNGSVMRRAPLGVTSRWASSQESRGWTKGFM